MFPSASALGQEMRKDTSSQADANPPKDPTLRQAGWTPAHAVPLSTLCLKQC